MSASGRYLPVIQQLDAWQGAAARAHPGVIPCRSGCSACCNGPFDISAADALLLRNAVQRLPAAARTGVLERAESLVDEMREMAPRWAFPYDIADLGEELFDDISDALAEEPCPLLDEEGRCLVYEARPLVCRLMGLGMIVPGGEVIENACPIQDDVPKYASLPPQPFDLAPFEAAEAECVSAAERELGVPKGYETTIAMLLAGPAAG